MFPPIDFLFSQSKGVTEDGIKLALPISSSKSDRTPRYVHFECFAYDANAMVMVTLELAMRSLTFSPQVFVLLNLVLVIFSSETAAQDLTISVTSLEARPDDTSLDSFIVDGSRMASFLLGSSKPSLMWATVSFLDANAVCEQFHVKNLTGSFSFNINVDYGRKVTTKSGMTLGQVCPSSKI